MCKKKKLLWQGLHRTFMAIMWRVQLELNLRLFSDISLFSQLIWDKVTYLASVWARRLGLLGVTQLGKLKETGSNILFLFCLLA